MKEHKDYLAILIPLESKPAEANKDRIVSKGTNQKYAEGWENIFGSKKDVGQA